MTWLDRVAWKGYRDAMSKLGAETSVQPPSNWLPFAASFVTQNAIPTVMQRVLSPLMPVPRIKHPGASHGYADLGSDDAEPATPRVASNE